MMRNEILRTIEEIVPYDDTETLHKEDTIRWINSGAGLYRLQKPDIPPKHLVSYFIIIDLQENLILLVDHIKAGLWLPPGGHVETDEHPATTVKREILEELNIEAEFLNDKIFFLTQAVTVGLTAGHTDVSLWYVLRGDSKLVLEYDKEEFNGYEWLSPDEILNMAVEKLDPHMHRFVRKWNQTA